MALPPRATPPDTRSLGASNLAAWHDGLLRSLGLSGRWEDGFWGIPERVPVIYHNAVTLGEARDGEGSMPARLGAYFSAELRSISVCDSFAGLDLRRQGFRVVESSRWMVRAPQPVPRAVTDLTVARVEDDAGLNTWEECSLAGFEVRQTERLKLQGVGVLEDRRYQFWLGWSDGRAVAAGMSFVDHASVGLYAISVIPEARRRGFARAITTELLRAAPALPAILQPSEAAATLYRELGFVDAGPFTVWARA
jgi:GNAT superfamily N-acetyltransferase